MSSPGRSPFEFRTLRALRWTREAFDSGHHGHGREAALSDEQRAARLELLAERLLSPDGLDRDTLARIEQLTDEQ